MTQEQIVVGQILFIVPAKAVTITPFLVTEEVVRKTLAGTEVTYRGTYGQEKSVVELKSINGKIFHSPDEAKSFLFANVLANINKLLNQAVSKAKEWYPEGQILEKKTPQELSAFETPINSDINFDEAESEEQVIITLPDGTRARLQK